MLLYNKTERVTLTINDLIESYTDNLLENEGKGYDLLDVAILDGNKQLLKAYQYTVVIDLSEEDEG